MDDLVNAEKMIDHSEKYVEDHMEMMDMLGKDDVLAHV